MKTFKGFNKDMTCRGYQYKEGETYIHESELKCCPTQKDVDRGAGGFHGCEYPLDCLAYYEPAQSVYHEVEQNGKIDCNVEDTKIASTKIKIGAEINIAGLVKAAIEYTTNRIKPEVESVKRNGASSATGDYGASSATGDYGASSATGDKGASSATGNCGASSATGDKGASSAGNKDSVAVAWGYKSKAKGVLGSYLVLADWDGDENNWTNPESWTLKGVKMVQVDGDKILENIYYTMWNGEIEEAE